MLSAVLFISSLSLPALSGPHVPDTGSTGIYIVIKGKKNDDCQNRIFSHNRKTMICVTPKPIIAEEVFESATEIKNDEGIDKSYFDLILSRAGSAKLKSIMTKLPGTELALVVDGVLVGLVKDANLIGNRVVQINGEAYSEDVLWAHINLKRIITSRK